MTHLRGLKSACFVLILCTAAAVAAPAQTFTLLFTFDGKDGSDPNSLVQGLDGNLYGTTGTGGGRYNGGTVFKITPTGSLTTLFSFCPVSHHCITGANPQRLTLGMNGTLYGTTSAGGRNRQCCSGAGTAFRINPTNGGHTKMYNFCARERCTDGATPRSGLVQGLGGNWYGTTAFGGTGDVGTVFKMTPKGSLTTLYTFCPQGGNCPDGSLPAADLILASDGSFYGTTELGGANGFGTVFKITASGRLTTIYNFCSQTNCADGDQPGSALVQASDGNLYGVTPYGGTGPNCNSGNCGTVFKITTGGTLTTLYSFCARTNCSDGYVPLGSLVQATDGNFYGTTALGGSNYEGTIFKITPGGTLTTLYSFCPQSSCTDGYQPSEGLLQLTDGNLYGLDSLGGTFFRLSVGLGPFVKALPYAGAAGKAVKILGQGLTGTTAVSFNGAAANFAVQSDTYLIATVPQGATTGFITVSTPGAVLTSNNQFRVLP
jgi:uncharacterized repeat protein (TIGR03803 family)